MVFLPAQSIRPNPAQPRKVFKADALDELADSIRQHGILQPLSVRRVGAGYELIAGERRLRAARIAGLATVPCVPVAADARQRQALTLIENLQRQDMTCFETARGIRELMDTHELTQCEVAHQLGLSQSAVANKLRLLRLSEEEQEELTAAGLTERHARALIRLADHGQRVVALRRVVEGKLTVAQTERLVEERLTGKTRRRPARPLVRDVRVFFNTVNHALDVMRRGGIPAESHRRDEEDYIEYVVRIPKTQNALPTQRE